MKFGQMSLKKISDKADYLQLDICGLSLEEAIERYNSYGKNIPIILHGDWYKKVNGIYQNEDNLKLRASEYKKIICELKKHTEVLGITIHPPKRKKYSIEEIISVCEDIKSVGVDVFIENRSDSRLNISNPLEVIELSNKHIMTIDIPQLYIACGYNKETFLDTLNSINWSNVQELHLSNVKNKRVAVKLECGELDYIKILKIIQSKAKKSFYITFEVIGSCKTFESQIEIIEGYIKSIGGVE
ncbi:hypothetical protein [Clostridium perfringens]|uniref:hypothetical protein n=1 Tax=Clostridium perfringens TaxID=1502 RepID=UPI0024BD1DC4|nr:hypothetical protein [Clostridium perfringens]